MSLGVDAKLLTEYVPNGSSVVISVAFRVIITEGVAAFTAGTLTGPNYIAEFVSGCTLHTLSR